MIGFSLFFSIFPSFIQIPLRRVFGQKIGKGSKIGFGSILIGSNVQIGNNVIIQPLSVIICEKITIGDNSTIKSFSLLKTRIVELKEYVHIANLCVINSSFTENSLLTIGVHSRIFPFCWLETGEGIEIGNHVGIGGHTLIFTHGVWTNYLKGGPISYAPVKIEDEVWLPWRVFIMPGVTIGAKSIIGANSLVNKSIPYNSLAAGTPSKIIKENFVIEIDETERKNRINIILNDFGKYLVFKRIIRKYLLTDDGLLINDLYLIGFGNVSDFGIRIIENDEEKFDTSWVNFDKLIMGIKRKDNIAIEFSSFVRKYGIRLNILK